MKSQIWRTILFCVFIFLPDCQTDSTWVDTTLTLFHDEYVSIYVGMPGFVLNLRYDFSETQVVIFDDSEYRKHSGTLEVNRVTNMGSEIFHFPTGPIRLPLRSNKPDKFSQKFYDGFWIKLDGVLGLGAGSTLWDYWDAVEITPGKIHLYNLPRSTFIQPEPHQTTHETLSTNNYRESDPLDDTQIHDDFAHLQSSVICNNTFIARVKTPLSGAKQLDKIMTVRIQPDRELSMLPSPVFHYLFPRQSECHPCVLEFTSVDGSKLHFTLTPEDFNTQNFPWKSSQRICEINHIDDEIILGRSCLHNKRCQFAHLHHSEDECILEHDFEAHIPGTIKLVSLQDDEVGIFKNRMKKDGGFAFPILVMITVIIMVFSNIEKTDSQRFLWILDLFSITLGFICMYYYLVAIGMFHTHWELCNYLSIWGLKGQATACELSFTSYFVISFMNSISFVVELILVYSGRSSTYQRNLGRTRQICFLITCLWLPITVHAYWSSFALALCGLSSSATSIVSLVPLLFRRSTKQDNSAVFVMSVFLPCSATFLFSTSVSYYIWRIFFGELLFLLDYVTVLVWLLSVFIPCSVAFNVALKIKKSSPPNHS